MARSTLTPLNDDQIRTIRGSHPLLPDDYLEHMQDFGWGKLLNGCMLYSGPIHPTDIYGERLADSPVLILGDDMGGYCFGFDPANGAYGEYSPDGNWEPWDSNRTIRDYVVYAVE